MTVTETLHRPAAAPRTRRKAATSDREAAEFVAYPERKAAALARALSRAIAGEVRFSAGDRALYSTDGSNYRQVTRLNRRWHAARRLSGSSPLASRPSVTRSRLCCPMTSAPAV